MGLLPALWSGGDSALQALSPVVQGAKAWGRSAQAMGRAVVSGPPSQQLLPVAGLDAVSAQSVFFALKQALDGPEVGVRMTGRRQLRALAAERLLHAARHMPALAHNAAPKTASTPAATHAQPHPGGSWSGEVATNTVGCMHVPLQGVHVMEAWLQALQLAQAASDRWERAPPPPPCF